MNLRLERARAPKIQGTVAVINRDQSTSIAQPGSNSIDGNENAAARLIVVRAFSPAENPAMSWGHAAIEDSDGCPHSPLGP